MTGEVITESMTAPDGMFCCAALSEELILWNFFFIFKLLAFKIFSLNIDTCYVLIRFFYLKKSNNRREDALVMGLACHDQSQFGAGGHDFLEGRHELRQQLGVAALWIEHF